MRPVWWRSSERLPTSPGWPDIRARFMNPWKPPVRRPVYRRVGAVTIATHPERTTELARQAAMARQCGVACENLTAGAVAERWPDLDPGNVHSAIYMPGDGQTNPVDTTQALVRLARRSGARVLEHTPVLAIDRRAGKVIGVRTPQGPVRCSAVVVCAGLWSRHLVRPLDVVLPLYPAEHFYAVTEPVAIDIPIVRDPDHGVYIKPDAGRALVGCFERHAKPLDPNSLPADFAFDELPFDMDHFLPYFEAATQRLPPLASVGVRTWFNGPESFTPDGRYILGETPEVRRLFVAAGFNSIGIQSAGGVGRAIADWVVDGHPPMDLWDVDVRRFFSFHNNDNFLIDRTAESLGRLYAMHWPYQQFESSRNIRRSALHDRLAAAGACFGELAGWERANWFARAGQEPRVDYSYQRQNWFDNTRAEHEAVRRSVALFDQSSVRQVRGCGAAGVRATEPVVAPLTSMCRSDASFTANG